MRCCLCSGTILNSRYRIESVIDSGGMGCVYRATHLTVDRTVAVKTLHPDKTPDSRAIKRFYQEAKIAANLGNDNICEVIDMGIAENGTLYLVMPFLTGCSLGQLIEKSGTIQLERAVDITCQTLRALESAHQKHIIHRDLKPDNIFITRMGDRDDFVKLLDFGISKIISSGNDLDLTLTGVTAGTPCFMAPEQAEGRREIDYRVDIYGIGVLLYNMLTGKRPFDGETYNAIIAKILSKPFVLPRVHNKQIPRSVENIILTAMSRDPRKRYRSAAEMRHALDAAVKTKDEYLGSSDMHTRTDATNLSALSTDSTGCSALNARARKRVVKLFLSAGMAILIVCCVYITLIFLFEERRPFASGRSDLSNTDSSSDFIPEDGDKKGRNLAERVDFFPVTYVPPQKSREVSKTDGAAPRSDEQETKPRTKRRTKRPNKESPRPSQRLFTGPHNTLFSPYYGE